MSQPAAPAPPVNTETPRSLLLKQKVKSRRAPKGLERVNVVVFGVERSGRSSLINTWVTALSNTKRIHYRANVGKSPYGEPIHTTPQRYLA